MTERWEQQLRDLHVEAPPEMWRRVQEGPRREPPVGLPPSRERVVAAVVALAVFVAAGVFAWRAFNPRSTALGSATPAPSSGQRVYTDPLGWTATYPSDWHAFITERTSDGLGTGVTFSNRGRALRGPIQGYVMLSITHALNATADPSAGSSAFPLSASDFKPEPGPMDSSVLDFAIDGVHYLATLRIGAAASKADVAAMDTLIASIRPSASTADVLRVVCRADGTAEVLTPLVHSMPDGLHVLVDNVGGAEALIVRQPSRPEAAWSSGSNGLDGEFVMLVPPGESFAGCFSSGSPAPSAGASLQQGEASFTVVDPEGNWVPTDLACSAATQAPFTVTPGAAVVDGESPAEAAARLLPGLQVADTVERAGYVGSSSQQGWVRVVRDDKVMAWFIAHGAGGIWSFDGYACVASGIGG